nr:histidine acid phosphatase, eukaryotic [Tanacetum cinerariifolium]
MPLVVPEIRIYHIEQVESSQQWHLLSSAGGTFLTSSGNFFWQWELITGSGNALSILFLTALLGAKEFFVNKKQEKDFDNIKRDIKHERYVHTAKTMVEYILANKLVFDPGGKRVCDLGGSHGRNVSRKHAIETNCKSQILVVVTSYVRVEKSLLGSKEYEFGGVREMTFSLEKVLEYSKRIREPVRYEVRKGIKENVFVPEEVPGQCTLISLNLVIRHGTCAPTKKRIRDLDVLSTRVKELVKIAKEIRSRWSSSLSMEIRGREVTKFGLIKEKAFEISESEFVMELMLITNMCDKPFESMSISCEFCYSQWSYVVVIEFVWKGDRWPMKSGVNCIIIVSVEGVSQLNHLDSCQSIMEEEVPEADIKVPEQVDTKAPRPVLEIVDNELVPEI